MLYFQNIVAAYDHKVVELDRHKVSVFLGNYSEYAVKKAQAREAQLKQYYNQQQEIKRQEEERG